MLATGLAQLSAGRTLLLFGETGIGKTHLGNLLVQSLLGTGRRVARLKPTPSGTGLLWNGFAQSAVDLAATQRPVETTMAAIVKALDVLPTPRPTIFVDDAHLLDDEVAKWLAELIAEERILLLATVKARFEGDHRAVERFTQLWLDDLATRIDLTSFDVDQTDAMITSLSDDLVVDQATRLAVYRASGGNPLTIRELMQDVREQGARAGAATSLVFPLSPSPSMRMQALITHRAKGLSAAELEGLVMMARLDGVPLERANRYIGSDILRRLVTDGFLSVDAAGSGVTVARRIDAESIAATVDGVRLSELARSAAREMLLAHRAGIVLHPLEYVFIAEAASADRLGGVVELDTGPVAVDCPSRAEEWAEICQIAALKSLAMGSLYSALTFARESISSSPTVISIVEESRAQAAMRNYPAALSTLDQLDGLPLSAYTRDSALIVLRWRISLASWIVDPVALEDRVAAVAEAISEADAGDILRLRDALEAALATDWRAGMSAVTPLAESAEAHPLTRLAATGILCLTFARLGKGAELSAAVRSGLRLVSQLTSSTKVSESLLTRREINHFYCSLSMAQIVAGIDVRGVGANLVQAMDLAIQRRDFGHVPMIGLLLGYVEFGRGDHEIAETELRLAAERFTVAPDSRWELWLSGLRARSLARLGRGADAADVLANTENASSRDYPLRHLVVDWARLDLESSSAMVDLALDLTARSGTATLELLFHAVELGAEVTALVPRVEELRERTDLPAFRAMADALLGLGADDPERIDEAAQHLAEAEYLSFARSAALWATGLYAAKGRRVAAAASTAFAESLTLDADSPVPLSSDTDSLADLTPREREIVLLVASGLSNRDIAAQLFLSVRTVESHFYQARVKLGAPSRRELSAQLKSRPLDY